MSFKRSTAVTLATITMTLGAGGPALAMPIHDAPTVSQVVPSEVVPSALPSDSDEGMATLVVVLLSTGALAAGAAAGFGGARVSAARTPLHRQ
jgi:hypothetical protein